MWAQPLHGGPVGQERQEGPGFPLETEEGDLALCPTMSLDAPLPPASGSERDPEHQGFQFPSPRAQTDWHRQLSWVPSLQVEANSSW